MIRKVEIKDVKEICEIFNHYVLNSISTFEMQEVSIHQMQEKIKGHNSNLPWLAYIDNGEILGYVKVNDWKSGTYNKSAYINTYESSVYIKIGHGRKGIGSVLYKEMFKCLKKLEYYTVIGGIALPNPASVALHENFNFKKVAYFKELGFKFGKRVDVGYWQNIKN